MADLWAFTMSYNKSMLGHNYGKGYITHTHYIHITLLHWFLRNSTILIALCEWSSKKNERDLYFLHACDSFVGDPNNPIWRHFTGTTPKVFISKIIFLSIHIKITRSDTILNKLLNSGIGLFPQRHNFQHNSILIWLN